MSPRSCRAHRRRARFERVAFVDTAALAVRLLDDAILAARFVSADGGLRIGVIGRRRRAAQARRSLYVLRGAGTARTIGQALAEGCLRGAVAWRKNAAPCAPARRVRRWRSAGRRKACRPS
jgi:hypothetical protein